MRFFEAKNLKPQPRSLERMLLVAVALIAVACNEGGDTSGSYGSNTTTTSASKPKGPAPATAPTITVPASSVVSTGNTLTVSGTCPADAVAVNIYANGTSVLTNVACAALAFSTTVTETTDNLYSITATGVSSYGTEGTASNAVSWTRDTTAPTISSLAFVGGSSVFATTSLAINITASDGATGSGISYYCYSESNASTCPSGTWLAYAGGTNRTVVASYSNGSRNMYVWLKDAMGNISTASSIAFTMALSSAPIISSFTVANTATPSTPPRGSETTFGSTAVAMHLWWTATVAKGTAANPYSLYYSTDQVNWTTISASFGSVATGTVAVNEANITAYNVPSTSAIYIRIGITDSLGQVTYRSSSKLNTSNWRLVAGNSDRGLGGSGISARLNSGWVRGNQTIAYSQSTRRIYFLDYYFQKLTYFDPDTGLWKGTSVSCNPIYGSGLAIDDTNQLLYMSCADGVVYKVNLSNFAVSTFYTATAGSSCAITLDSTATNLYTCFDDKTYYRIPIGAGGTPGAPVLIMGNGVAGAIVDGGNPLTNPAQYLGWSISAFSKAGTFYIKDWAGNLWRFNSTFTTITKVTNTAVTTQFSSMTQGRSGEELLIASGSGIYAVNGTTGATTLLVGHLTISGDQTDGSDALSTRIAVGEGILVSPEGNIFFVDQVSGVSSAGLVARVRTIDSSNKIQTVLGTMASYGTGGDPLAAKFPTNANFTFNPYDGKIYTYESAYARVIDFGANTVSAFTGDGTSSTLTSSTNGYWAFWSATTFALGYTYAYTPILYSSVGTMGASFWYSGTTNSMTTTGAALSPADGQNRSTVYNPGDIYYSVKLESDGAGNVFVGSGDAPTPNPKRIFKIDAAGVFHQLLGNNVTTGLQSTAAALLGAYAADCAGANCAQTLHWNGGAYYGYQESFAYSTGKLIYADFDGTNCKARAIDLSNDSLTTLATPGGGVGCNSTNRGRTGDYAAANGYVYWGAPSRLYKIAVSNGAVTDLGATPIEPTGVVIGSQGGNPMIYDSGVLYEYAP